MNKYGDLDQYKNSDDCIHWKLKTTVLCVSMPSPLKQEVFQANRTLGILLDLEIETGRSNLLVNKEKRF